MRTMLLGLLPAVLVAAVVGMGLRSAQRPDPDAELARLRRGHLGHDGRYELCIAGYCPRPGEAYRELRGRWGPERMASWYLDRRMAGWVAPETCVIGVFDRQDRLDLVLSCEEASELAPLTAPPPAPVARRRDTAERDGLEVRR